MSFLKISSFSKTNSTDMFTLGVSTSRGNAEKIGQFGSGCLMATLLWIRLYGTSPIFMINGRRVEFTCKPERTTDGSGTFRRIFMNEEGEITPMSVALEYGEIDWRSHEMALREFISNAIDQGSDIVESMSVCKEIEGRKDCVEVYIPINPDVTKYWHNIDRYFLHFNNKQHDSILSKDKLSNCRVYRRGVFIREMEFVSLFDYNLDFDINESRNGSSDSIEREIYRLCSGYNSSVKISKEHQMVILNDAITNRSSKCIEKDTPGRYGLRSTVWKDVIYARANGKKYTIMIEDRDNICVPSYWYNAIVERYKDLDGLMNVSAARKSADFIVLPANKETVDIAKSLWEKLELYDMTNGKEFPNIEMFKTRNGNIPNALGMYAGGTVSIWVDQASSKQTILEELLHHASGFCDGTISFQEFIIRTLTEAMEAT